MDTTNNLYTKLWSASDDLRSQMDANEHMISNFASQSDKNAGEFYTSYEVRSLVSTSFLRPLKV